MEVLGVIYCFSTGAKDVFAFFLYMLFNLNHEQDKSHDTIILITARYNIIVSYIFSGNFHLARFAQARKFHTTSVVVILQNNYEF